MTPQQKIKHMILNRIAEFQDVPPPNVTAENVDQLYDQAESDEGYIYDARSEVRCGGEETGIPAPFSRHYEAKSVAAQAPDGSWVGWTYWYGGGKHGEPEAMDWIEDAYDLTMTEKEVTIMQRTFSIVAPAIATAPA